MTSLKKPLIIALALLATSCGTIRSEPQTLGKPCPPLKAYTAQETTKALGEYDWLRNTFEPCVLCGMLDDFALMRDQCR